MPSGYQVNGTDLDSIFALLQSSMTPAAATGFLSGNLDLKFRYAPLAYGGPASATKFKLASGADLNTVFAELGTTSITVVTNPSAVAGSSAAGTPSGTVTSVGAMTCSVIGGLPPYAYTWHVSGGGVALSPNAPTTRIAGTVTGETTLSGSAFCTITDADAHTVNTSSASYALQNLSPSNTFNFTVNAGFGLGSAVGYVQASSAGSITPSPALADGSTIFELATGSMSGALIYILGGFSSDPTAAHVTSLTINGQTWVGTGASYFYNSGSGRATWNWAGANLMTVGDSYPATMVTNA